MTENERDAGDRITLDDATPRPWEMVFTPTGIMIRGTGNDGWMQQVCHIEVRSKTDEANALLIMQAIKAWEDAKNEDA